MRLWFTLLLPLCFAIACRAERGPSASGSPVVDGVEQAATLNISDADPASEVVAAPLAEEANQAAPDALAPTVPAAPAVPTTASPESIRAAWVAEEPDSRTAALAGAVPLEGDACRVDFDHTDRVYKLGPVPVSFPPTSSLANEGWSALSMFPVDDALLVGVGPSFDGGGFHGVVNGSSTLWKFDCRAPNRFPEAFVEVNDAHFRHAAIDPGKTRIAFAHPAGIGALDLVSRRIDVLAPNPALELWHVHGFEHEHLPVMVPIRWVEDGLVVAIAAPPLYWDRTWELAHWLVDIEDEVTRSEPHRYVRALDLVVAVDRGGRIWLGLKDEVNPEALWRSSDGGATWDRAHIERLDLHVVTHMVPDAVDPDTIVVWGQRLTADESEPKRLITSDAGRSWTAIEWVEEPAPTAKNRLEVESSGAPVVYDVSPRGLWRSTQGGERVLVFPPPNLLPPLYVEGRPIEPRSPRKPITWADWDEAIADNRRGLALAKKGKLSEALEAYAESWTANPNHLVSRYNAACAHALLGRPREAMKLLEALQATGGFRGLTLLAAAAGDSDLVSLRPDRRFRELTTATAPRSVWSMIATEGQSEVQVFSDVAERLCLVLALDTSDEQISITRLDCATGAARGKLVGTFRETVVMLDDLGARRWSAITEDDANHREVRDWAKVALGSLDLEATLFRSPSGGHVAAVLDYDAGAPSVSPWPAAPALAFVGDADEGEVVTYGLPTVSEDGKHIAYIAHHNVGPSSRTDLVVNSAGGRRTQKLWDTMSGSAGPALVRRVTAARALLGKRRWRPMKLVDDAPDARRDDYLSDDWNPHLKHDGSVLVELNESGMRIHRLGEDSVWQREWPTAVTSVRGTTWEDGEEVPCELTMHGLVYSDPTSELVLIELAHREHDHVCRGAESKLLTYPLPTSKQTHGWSKVARDPAPGWLDLPDYAERADKLSEGAVDHIKEVLRRWEPFFPEASGVQSLRAIIDAHEGESTKRVP